MHTLVVNLTRFGDLLQTQPVLSGLKAAGHRTSLVCLDTFQGATALLRDLDAVVPLPGARFLALVDQGWPLAVAALRLWSEQCLRTHPDRILNLTPTLSARLLGQSLGHAGDGFGLDAFGFGQYSSPWAAFLQAASKHRGCSPFNLVDLFQRVAGLSPGSFALKRPDSEALARADALLGADSALVAFQLGASQDYRRWPVDAFVRVGRVLWREVGLRPVLLGTGAEAHLGEAFGHGADYPFTNLIGRTNIPTLAAVLTRTRLLLTNDTGTMHLAAGLGVPVVAIFLATAQPFDTGPYQVGSISLEPDIPCHPCTFGRQCPHGLACRERIDPEAVGAMIVAFARSGQWTASSELGARVWVAKRDGHGFMDLEDISPDGHGDRSSWIQAQRGIYRQFLDKSAVMEIPAPTWRPSPFKRSLRADLERGLLLLTLVEEQARLLIRGAPESIRKKFLVNCQNFQDFLDASRGLGVLGPMWMYQSQEAARSMEGFVALCGRYGALLTAFQNCLGMDVD